MSVVAASRGLRPWTVTLVCGASGIGKSSVATPLAARYGVPLGEADDIVTGVQALTTAEQQPALHYWNTHPEARELSAIQIADLHLQVAATMSRAFQAVIADHVEFRAPVVLEGDYLLPALARGFGGAVRAVVLDEGDPDQIVANYLQREPDSGPQHARAEVSTVLNARLVEQARDAGVPVVPVRPWADGVRRVDAALRHGWE
jgi:2-phosphoglycerate kinase